MFKKILSIFLLIILFFIADYESLKNVLKKISLIVFVWLVILQFFALFLNTYKWKVFIPNLNFNQLLKFNLITFFYNVIVPGQGAGEVVKIYKMRGALSIDRVIISVAIERIFSLFTALLVCLYGLYFTNYQYPKFLEYAVILVIILIIAAPWVVKSIWLYLRKSHIFVLLSILTALGTYGNLYSAGSSKNYNSENLFNTSKNGQELLNRISKNTKILSTKDAAWIKSFSDANYDNVYELLYLPPL
jgi:uncharacterized protein (TIRG00374 family)